MQHDDFLTKTEWTSRHSRGTTCQYCPMYTQQQRRARALRRTTYLLLALLLFAFWGLFGAAATHVLHGLVQMWRERHGA